MNKEEIEELKDFTIDLTDIDEIALGLEVCSKKSNMVIQEFADTIIQLQQENKQQNQLLKDKGFIIDKLMEENKQLKEEKQEWINLLAMFKNQQKEFIDYLEDKICISNKVLDEQEEDEEVRGYVLARKFMLEEILSKYQEIIGGKE